MTDKSKLKPGLHIARGSGKVFQCSIHKDLCKDPFVYSMVAVNMVDEGQTELVVCSKGAHAILSRLSRDYMEVKKKGGKVDPIRRAAN